MAPFDIEIKGQFCDTKMHTQIGAMSFGQLGILSFTHNTIFCEEIEFLGYRLGANLVKEKG